MESLTRSPVDRELLPLVSSYFSNRRVSFFHGNELQTYQVKPTRVGTRSIILELSRGPDTKGNYAGFEVYSFRGRFPTNGIVRESNGSLEFKVNNALGAFKEACGKRGLKVAIH